MKTEQLNKTEECKIGSDNYAGQARSSLQTSSTKEG